MELRSGFQDVYTDLQGLNRLRLAARAQDPEAVGEVARQFEGLFVQMMLKEMRNTGFDEALFGSHQMRMYQEMYDQQIALEVTRGKGIGLAAVIERQISRQLGLQGDSASAAPVSPLRQLYEERPFGVPAGRNPAPPGKGQAMEPVRRAVETVREAVETRELPDRFGSPAQFVEALMPLAESAGRRLGVDPRLLLAQAALETGWGEHLIRDPDGSNSHNLFGIKAGADWEGERVRVASLEHLGGRARKQVSEFRAYSSYADSFADYVAFLQSRPWYREALAGAADPARFIRELQRAGYATDPNYADKVLTLYSQPELRAARLRLAATEPPR